MLKGSHLINWPICLSLNAVRHPFPVRCMFLSALAQEVKRSLVIFCSEWKFGSLNFQIVDPAI